MLSVLMESNPAPRARRGAGVVSMALHGGLIALGAWATDAVRAPVAAASPEWTEVTVFASPSPPPQRMARPARVSGTSSRVADVPAVEPVDVGPIELSSGIPEIDYALGSSLGWGPDASSSIGTAARATGGPVGAGIIDNLVADKPALPLDGNAPPRYPGALRAAAIEGTVDVEFIIEPTGRVRIGSLVAIRHDHPLFLDAVRQALSTYRYLPAEAGGRAVAVRVRQRFQFVLER